MEESITQRTFTILGLEKSERICSKSISYLFTFIQTLLVHIYSKHCGSKLALVDKEK
jgi:hypothetical protein